jgi:hypothetical protein
LPFALLKPPNVVANKNNKISDMKKIFLIGFLVMIFSIKVTSQVGNNTFLIGGYCDFYKHLSERFDYTLDPNIALFVGDKLCLGLTVPLKNEPDGLNWGLTPFARFYFNPKESNSFFLLGSVGLTSFINSNHTNVDRALSVGLGYTWFLKRVVGLEAGIKGASSFHNVDLGLFVGIQFYLNNNK